MPVAAGSPADVRAVRLSAQLRCEPQIGLHVFRGQPTPRGFVAPGMRRRQMDAEDVREREVRLRIAEASHSAREAGRDQPAARRHTRARPRSDRRSSPPRFGEDECLEAVPLGVATDIVGVDQDVRDTRADERLQEAALRQRHLRVGVLAPEEVVMPLRIDDADCRDGRRLIRNDSFAACHWPIATGVGYIRRSSWYALT